MASSVKSETLQELYSRQQTSWWADKPGNWHSQSKQDQTVASLFRAKAAAHFSSTSRPTTRSF